MKYTSFWTNDCSLAKVVAVGNCMILDEKMRTEINFRDLGGCESVDGRVLRSGVFYRSCNLSRWNTSELYEMYRLQIRTILDLRTDYEVYESPDLLPADVHLDYFRVSGMRDSNSVGVDFSPEGIRRMVFGSQSLREHMQDIYLSMMYHNQAFAFLWMMIQESGHLPLLFHCATGKDRTGAVSMLLLMALNIRKEDILADYVYSNVSFASRIQDAYAAHAKEIASDPSLSKKLLQENGVDPDLGKAMLDGALSKYPDRETFFEKEYQISREELKAFQNSFLDAKI